MAKRKGKAPRGPAQMEADPNSKRSQLKAKVATALRQAAAGDGGQKETGETLRIHKRELKAAMSLIDLEAARSAGDAIARKEECRVQLRGRRQICKVARALQGNAPLEVKLQEAKLQEEAHAKAQQSLLRELQEQIEKLKAEKAASDEQAQKLHANYQEVAHLQAKLQEEAHAKAQQSLLRELQEQIEKLKAEKAASDEQAQKLHANYQEVVEQQVMLNERLERQLLQLKQGQLKQSNCVICRSAEPDQCFLPCRHLACCGTCLKEMQARSGMNFIACPVCREQAKMFMKIFKS
ncbi:unnamed protein product [Effrenium voratum]|uniref:RING-type domain-containing protein n=1 Tax=Effrenium voratum TaxID=2562239 RepID=A0AA36MKS0_9DINO|nr:unnamed protein product [Effrenium voratum]